MADADPIPPDAITAVRSRDAQGLVAALAPLTDKHRRQLREPLRDRVLRHHRLGLARRDWPLDLQTLDLVIELGCGDARDVAWGWWRLTRDPSVRPVQLAVAADMLAHRPTSVRRSLARAVCEPDGSASAAWPVLRSLQQRGLLDDLGLTDDDLAVGATRGVWHHMLGTDAEVDWQDPPDDALTNAIRADPLLAADLLRGLLHPPALDAAPSTWPTWIADAVAAGVLPRDEVLASVLRSQDADVRPSTAQLLRRILDALAPTEDELAPHEAQLVRILADGHPSAQRQVAGHLRALAAGTRLTDTQAVAHATVGPLTGRQKGAAMAALRLLDTLQLDDQTVATAAVVGLSHAHEDVQGSALDLVEGHSPDGPPAAVREEALLHLDTVSPAHRDRVAVLAGVADVDPGGQAIAAVDATVLRERAGALPDDVRHTLRTDAAQEAADTGRPPDAAAPPPAAAPPGVPIEPVTDVAELGELLNFLLGGSAGPMDLERAIDGLARFDGRTAPATVTSVVARHARSAFEQGLESGSGVLGHLVWQVAGSWASGTRPGKLDYLRPAREPGRLRLRRRPAAGGLLHELVTPPRATHELYEQGDGGAAMAGLVGLVQARLYEAVVISQHTARPTLALPTCAAGWIEADVLADRVAALDATGRRPARHEAVTALLRLRDPVELRGRLPRDGATAAIAAAIDGDAAADPALRRALDRGAALGELTLAADERRPGLVRTTPWFAVPDLPPWRRDDPVGQLLREVTERESRHATSWWNPGRNVLPEADRPLMRWAPSALPHAAHLLAGAATRSILVDPDADRSSSAVDALLAHALDPDVPLRHPWHLLLATALRGGNRVAGITAADVVAAAAEDARLDPRSLGTHLAHLHLAGVGASNRVVERLEPVVTTSPLVAGAVRRALQAWVSAVEGLPRDLHHILGLLESACVASDGGIDDDATRTVLDRAAAGRSKRATIAARLLDLPAAAPAHEPALLAAAVLERAERWAAAVSPPS